jgi:Na+(H+)/acetate symporter ActP
LKAATGLTTLFALGIGLWSEQSVFSLVVWAWGTLGAAFVPILIWQVLGAKLNSLAMLCMSSTGVFVTVVWKFYGFPNTVYEGAVGMFTAFVLGAIFAVSSIRSRFNP